MRVFFSDVKENWGVQVISKCNKDISPSQCLSHCCCQRYGLNLVFTLNNTQSVWHFKQNPVIFDKTRQY